MGSTSGRKIFKNGHGFAANRFNVHISLLQPNLFRSNHLSIFFDCVKMEMKSDCKHAHTPYNGYVEV